MTCLPCRAAAWVIGSWVKLGVAMITASTRGSAQIASGSVETLSILAYLESNQNRYGPAAAYATLLFVYVAVTAFVFVKLLGADVLGDAVQKKKKKNGKERDSAPPGVAMGSAAGGDMRVDVLPGSGTGELAGLTGELTIAKSEAGEHTYSFSYELA